MAGIKTICNILFATHRIWWEFIEQVNISSIGFLEITENESGELRIVGVAHREDGSRERLSGLQRHAR